jgi:poly-gamma-glutamate capsule biosynthesis protein CapA/YwtB (metallophosphatase superfamily)
MTGRGVDQILPSPSSPELDEPVVKDARDYVRLAESVNGPIRCPVSYEYVWGDALSEFERRMPDLRAVNLETSITQSGERAPKGINYRMHPANAACLTAASLELAVLANNHILDYGAGGLTETIEVLDRIGIAHVGAGRDLQEAEQPASFRLGDDHRVMVLAFACGSSGVDLDWAATEQRPGVAYLSNLSETIADAITGRVRGMKRSGDLAILSVHWGPNWGYEIPRSHIRFAHHLIEGGIDVVYGHSSHHPLAVEIYRDRLILYGCGDLINDYEGIEGYEEFRGDLALMYFATFDPEGQNIGLWMAPMQMRKLQLHAASPADVRWLCKRLDEISRPFGSRIEQVEEQIYLMR